MALCVSNIISYGFYSLPFGTEFEDYYCCCFSATLAAREFRSQPIKRSITLVAKHGTTIIALGDSGVVSLLTTGGGI